MVYIIGEGSEDDSLSIRLATRENNFIKNRRQFERAPEALIESRRIFAEAHPDAKLRSLTAVYNCVGLVFGSRRTWIDPEQIRFILEDDKYEKIDKCKVTSGDVVLYSDDGGKKISHIGIVSCVTPKLMSGDLDIRVISKWGHDGEYFHALDDIPLLCGRAFEYWTDRKEHV